MSSCESTTWLSLEGGCSTNSVSPLLCRADVLRGAGERAQERGKGGAKAHRGLLPIVARFLPFRPQTFANGLATNDEGGVTMVHGDLHQPSVLHPSRVGRKGRLVRMNITITFR